MLSRFPGEVGSHDVTGWLCCSLVGWYDLLPMRCLHASPLTISLHVVTAYVMCVCREYVGSEANDEGEGKERKKEGRNGFDEQPYKAKIKAREAQNHNKYGKTVPSHLSTLVEHNFLHLW